MALLRELFRACIVFACVVLVLGQPSDEICSTSDVDLIFVIDGSGSVGLSNFNMVLSFASNLALHVPAARRRVALVQYSNLQRTEFTFNAHAGPGSDAGLNGAILGVNYLTGGTLTGVALDYTRDNIVGKDGDRPNVPNVVLVITDGLSGDNPGPAADRLRDQGHTVIALGIKGATMNQLLQIAGTPDLAIKINDFTDLDENLTKKILTMTCVEEDDECEIESNNSFPGI